MIVDADRVAYNDIPERKQRGLLECLWAQSRHGGRAAGSSSQCSVRAARPLHTSWDPAGNSYGLEAATLWMTGPASYSSCRDRGSRQRDGRS